MKATIVVLIAALCTLSAAQDCSCKIGLYDDKSCKKGILSANVNFTIPAQCFSANTTTHNYASIQLNSACNAASYYKTDECSGSPDKTFDATGTCTLVDKKYSYDFSCSSSTEKAPHPAFSRQGEANACGGTAEVFLSDSSKSCSIKPTVSATAIIPQGCLEAGASIYVVGKEFGFVGSVLVSSACNSISIFNDTTCGGTPKHVYNWNTCYEVDDKKSIFLQVNDAKPIVALPHEMTPVSSLLGYLSHVKHTRSPF